MQPSDAAVILDQSPRPAKLGPPGGHAVEPAPERHPSMVRLDERLNRSIRSRHNEQTAANLDKMIAFMESQAEEATGWVQDRYRRAIKANRSLATALRGVNAEGRR